MSYQSNHRGLLRRFHYEASSPKACDMPDFYYEPANSLALQRLRDRYTLDLIAGTGGEWSRIYNLCRWVHGRLKHDGSSQNPKNRTALHILDQCFREECGVNFTMSLSEKNFFRSRRLSKHLTLVSEDTGRDYDLFHSTYYTLPKNSKAKRVLTFHDTIYEDFPEYFANQEGFKSFMRRKELCVKTADHIVAVSNATKSKLLQYYEVNPSQVTVIHHGISNIFHDARKFKDVYEKKALKQFTYSKKFLLFVGGRRFYKNFISLLQAYAISQVNRDYDLVVVGSEDSFFEEEREILEQYGLQEKVKLLGFVTIEELVSIYLLARGLIFPTMSEGFGLPLIEAMACEIPIACSDIPVFREIAGDLPIYFNPYDIDSLVTKIEELVSDDSTPCTIMGKEKSLGFQWQDSVYKLMEVYSLSL